MAELQKVIAGDARALQRGGIVGNDLVRSNPAILPFCNPAIA
jgi:hypothetical protein